MRRMDEVGLVAHSEEMDNHTLDIEAFLFCSTFLSLIGPFFPYLGFANTNFSKELRTADQIANQRTLMFVGIKLYPFFGD